MAGGKTWHPLEDQFILDHPEMTPAELADAFRAQGRTPGACQKQRERLSQLKDVEIFSQDGERVRVVIPKSTKPKWDTQIHLPGPSALVLGDLHMDFHDDVFLSRCVELSLDWGITDVMIGGDLLDVEAFSKFGPDPENIFEHEAAAAEVFLDNMGAAFKNVKYSIGNHEMRILGKAMERQIKSDRFRRALTHADNVEISSYSWMTMDSPEGPWVIVHPKNASVVPGRVPSEIASNRFVNYHVIGLHGHLFALTKSKDGARWAWDVGMIALPSKIAYATKEANTRPAMVQGAGIIYEGRPHPLFPNSDFRALKRMYGRIV